MNQVELLFYTIGSSISILSQLVLIYGFFRVKVMKKHPELLVVWQCISQIILDSHWLTAISDINEFVSDWCQSIGAVFVYFYYISWDYILFLSLEILIKLRNPLNCNYSKRLQIYHMIAHLISLGIFSALVSVNNNDGKSVVGTCFVQKGSIYELIVFFPVLFHVPVCLGIAIYTFWVGRKNRTALQFKHHNLVVFVFTICWGTGALDHGLSYHNVYIDSMQFDLLVVILGAPAGFYLFLARMTQKGLFTKIFRSLCKRRQYPQESISDREELVPELNLMVNPNIQGTSLISQTFESFTAQVKFTQATADVLEGLTKYFKYCMNSDREY